DWIADYWSRVGTLPVRSQVAPGEVRASLPDGAPEQGEPFSAVLADLDRVVLPGVTHWQHPGFFGYFPANTSGPSVLRDLVSAGYTPVLVCATVGTTSTTAVDPLSEIGPICQKYGVWLHVDAAYAGVSAVVPELRELQAGVEWADSYTTDAHKWLLTGFDAT